MVASRLEELMDRPFGFLRLHRLTPSFCVETSLEDINHRRARSRHGKPFQPRGHADRGESIFRIHFAPAPTYSISGRWLPNDSDKSHSKVHPLRHFRAAPRPQSTH